MSTFTDSARSFSSSVANAASSVTSVLSTLQNSETPTSTDLGTAIGTLSSIVTAVTNFQSADSAGAFGPQTNSMLGDAQTLIAALQTAQSAIDNSSQGFVLQPIDANTLQNAVSAWNDFLAKNGALPTIADQIDAASSGPSAPGPAQLPASPGSSNSTSTSSSGTTTVTLPPTNTTNPPPAPPPSTTSKPSILPAVTPAAALAIGVGGLLLIGVIVSAMKGGPKLTLNPRPRRRKPAKRRRSARRRSRR